jgi:hypothetical protein
MVRKLGEQAAAAPAGAALPVQPKGWGAPAAALAGVTEEGDDQLPPTGAPTSARAAAPVQPKGWGPPAGAAPVAGSEQQEEIRGKIRAPVEEVDEDEEKEEAPASARALAAFPAGVVQQLTGEGVGGEDPDGSDAPPPAAAVASAAPAAEPAKRRRNTRKAGEEPPALPVDPSGGSDAGESILARSGGQEADVPRGMGTMGTLQGTSSMDAGAQEISAMIARTPNGRISLEYYGIPGEGLAAFFEALAQNFRSAGQ